MIVTVCCIMCNKFDHRSIKCRIRLCQCNKYNVRCCMMIKNYVISEITIVKYVLCNKLIIDQLNILINKVAESEILLQMDLHLLLQDWLLMSVVVLPKIFNI